MKSGRALGTPIQISAAPAEARVALVAVHGRDTKNARTMMSVLLSRRSDQMRAASRSELVRNSPSVAPGLLPRRAAGTEDAGVGSLKPVPAASPITTITLPLANAVALTPSMRAAVRRRLLSFRTRHLRRLHALLCVLLRLCRSHVGSCVIVVTGDLQLAIRAAGGDD